MQCPRCHGAHFVLVNGSRLPCPECGGLGEIHCCDGLQEQVDGPGVAPTGGACAPPGGDDRGADPPRPAGAP